MSVRWRPGGPRTEYLIDQVDCFGAALGQQQGFGRPNQPAIPAATLRNSAAKPPQRSGSGSWSVKCWALSAAASSIKAMGFPLILSTANRQPAPREHQRTR